MLYIFTVNFIFMNHISQDGISELINQLDDSTKQVITAVAGFGMLGVALYSSLSPDQKEKLIRCLRSVKDCASHVLTQIGENAALAIGGGVAAPNHNHGMYNNNNQYRNRDIELQLGLESISPRLQNALENNSNMNQRSYQR
jgi:hypothetical protein